MLRLNILATFLSLTVLGAWSQTPEAAPPPIPAPAGPVQYLPVKTAHPDRNLSAGSTDVATHVVRVGDQLEVNIFSMPELVKVYQVRADGRFFHPVAGEIEAAGLTLNKIEADLKKKLTKQLRFPAFQLGLASLAESQVSVLGEVKLQGKFPIRPGTSLLDLLAQAGGLTPKADAEGATILRDGKEIPVNLGNGSSGQAAKMVMLSGDILYVNAGRRIGVSGEVNEKGVFSISSHSRNPIEDAIKAAGGARETAALNRVLLVRPSLQNPIIVNILTKDPKTPLPAVEDGDTLMIPARHAVILGAADKQGQVPLTGSETLLDIISLIGASKGQLNDVVVIRAADVAAGIEKKEDYNLEQALKDGKMSTPVLINDGDLVYVPPKPEGGGVLQNAMPLMNLIYMAKLFF